MSYVLVENNAVVEYPYTYAKLRKDNPDTSFPREPGPWLEGFGVYEVVPSTKPAYNKNFNIVEGTPILVNGNWTQVWNEEPASPEEIAARTQAENDAAALDTVKTDTFVQTFIGYTPAQVETYVDNNTNNLAEVRALLKKIAVMQLIMAKRLFR